MATVLYKSIDDKMGITPGASPSIATGAPAWKNTGVYGAGAIVVNGPFAFSTAAGGTETNVNGARGPTPINLTPNVVTWVLLGAIAGLHDSELGVGPNDVGLYVPKQEPGFKIACKDAGPGDYGAGEAIYVKFTAATIAGQLVLVDRVNKTAIPAPIGVADKIAGFYGIALCSVSAGDVASAAGVYGWILVRGVHDAVSAAGAAAGDRVALLAAGQVTNALPGPTNRLAGATFKSALANAQAIVEVEYPMFMGV
jgi:hypothetical protein